MIKPIEEIQQLLTDRNLTEVERRTGIHRNTLMRVRSGQHTNLRYETLKTLSDYLSK